MAQEAQPTLAGDFESASEEDWRDAVDKALKGGSFERLVTTSADGIEVQPLYTDGPDESITGAPGSAPFTRGFTTAGGTDGAWDVRSEVSVSDVGEFNRIVLRELERGATSLLLSGPVIQERATLEGALDGVFLDLARMVLKPMGPFGNPAGLLAELWESRGISPEAALGNFGADPLGFLAVNGQLWAPVDDVLAELGELARVTSEKYPLVRAVTIDATAYAEAGGSEGQELAAMLSTGVAYLRAMQSAGMSAAGAGRSIEIVLGADADFFTTMAKVRAARRLWSTMASACGIDSSDVPPAITVRTLDRMMTRHDPWVNMLRVTSASFGAILGGADSVISRPFDSRWGDPVELSRRMSRNTQLLLGEESGGGRVVDPAGGSWYVETLTEELAQVGWELFRVLEGAGGMPGILLDSTFQQRIWEVRENRLDAVSHRRQPITGVSEFPDISEEPLADRSAADSADSSTDPAVTCDPLTPVHWSEGFEGLRDAAEVGSRPTVFLANLGPVATHTSRATFAKNFFSAGGFAGVTTEVGSTTGFQPDEQLAGDFSDSGAKLACICSSDAEYAASAVQAAKILKSAGADRIYLAGKPGDDESELSAAGVDEFIHVGVDALAILTDAHEQIGTL